MQYKVQNISSTEKVHLCQKCKKKISLPYFNWYSKSIVTKIGTRCPSCKRQYIISSEKFKKKVAEARCKDCNRKFTVTLDNFDELKKMTQTYIDKKGLFNTNIIPGNSQTQQSTTTPSSSFQEHEEPINTDIPGKEAEILGESELVNWTKKMHSYKGNISSEDKNQFFIHQQKERQNQPSYKKDSEKKPRSQTNRHTYNKKKNTTEYKTGYIMDDFSKKEKKNEKMNNILTIIVFSIVILLIVYYLYYNTP